jgi:MSHA biogenesis protein MshQ
MPLNNLPLKLMPLVLILVLVISIIGPGVAQADPGWYDSNWTYRKKITINAENVSGSSNLLNFPVLISLPSDSDLANDARNDGYDILFTAGDETTKLQHEIESFNGTTGNLTAWVEILSLSPTTNTDIYMYYGYAGSGDSSNATGVWDDANYKMVQHMEETSGGANAITDSTSNNNDGTDDNTLTYGATGQMDTAIGFNGSDDYIDSNTSFQSTFRGSFTISAWIKPDDGIPASQNSIVGSTNAATEDRVNVESPRNTGKVGFFYESNNNQARTLTQNAVFSDGPESWHYVVLVADSSASGPGAHKIYFDGVNQALDATDDGDNSAVTYADWTSSDNLWIGAYNMSGSGGNWFDGLIDEVRISNTVRDTDWIKTSYNNQNNPGDFFTLGSEETEIVIPTVTTNAASLIEETTATINGTLTSDGGEACQYSFEWGTAPGTYTDNISWTGSLNSGEFFSIALSGLNKGDVYYYRARARNSAGIGNGSEMSFLTKPDPPTSFTATTVSSSQINLSWTKGDGAVNTMVRGKQGSYPTSVTDGYPVYFDTGTNASDTGLLPSTTYYYSAWSEVTGSQQWSDDPPAQANATTTSGAPTVIGGLVLPVNKATVLAPWLFLVLILSLITARVILHFRKRRSRVHRH